MKKTASKRVFIFLLVLLIPIIAYCIYLYREDTVQSAGINEIFEIKNTREIYNYPDSNVITIMRHYMITYPPEKLDELKILVEKYYKDNPIDGESNVNGKKDRQYEVYFYRRSKKLPSNWQPEGAYFGTDRIGQHTDDCIAVIRWSDANPSKIYSIMRKSSSKEDYGSVIQEMTYNDDKALNQK